MTCEPSHRLPDRTLPACATMSAASPRIAATSLAKVIAAKRSETRPAEQRATFAVANETTPSSEPVAKRTSSRRSANVAEQGEMAALCQCRAARWAEGIRKGLDPDIARFMRDQATAWRLLATAYAGSASKSQSGQTTVE